MKREIKPEFHHNGDKKIVAHNVPVRNAATLLLIDWSGGKPRLLAGRRKKTLAFMPGLTVFPGGAVDKSDATMSFAGDLPEITLRRLQLRTSRLSQRAARALALAAIRETYEETGLLLGVKQKIPSPLGGGSGWGHPDRASLDAPHLTSPLRGEEYLSGSWKIFAAHGVTPTLGDLSLVARAITPPYRPRRFDTRFFMADRKEIAMATKPETETDLEKIEWLTLAEIFKKPLAFITRQVLSDIAPLFEKKHRKAVTDPLPYYYARGKKYFREMIGQGGGNAQKPNPRLTF